MKKIKEQRYDDLKQFLKAIESAENLGFSYRMSQYKGDEENKTYWKLILEEV